MQAVRGLCIRPCRGAYSLIVPTHPPTLFQGRRSKRTLVHGYLEVGILLLPWMEIWLTTPIDRSGTLKLFETYHRSSKTRHNHTSQVTRTAREP